MAIRFFDTRQRKLVPFEPLHPGEVRMYTCGPTVYDRAHIGNFRTFLFEDLLRRHLKARGFKVTQIMNLTDVDDKIIKGVNAKQIPIDEFTAPFKAAFFEDADTLRIQRAEQYPAATEHIDDMVKLVKSLLEKDHAYRADDGSIYYRIASFPKYGELSHMDLSQLKAGARVSSDEYEKDTVSDFAVWKAWDEGDGSVFWETELGKGRPGWHIECSAMSMAYLGESFDIHTGGVDNIFPHHENEIAQSEGATGKPFSKYWLHAEHLIVEGRKMSKSLGNFYTLRDLVEQGHPPVAIRYLLLSTHYRQQLNFTFDGIEGARSAIERLRDFHRRLSEFNGGGEGHDAFAEAVAEAREKFGAHLDDDLNISGALGIVFDFVRDTNRQLDKHELDGVDAAAAKGFIEEVDQIIDVLREDVADIDADEVERLIAERNEARKNKNFARSDEIRDQLIANGIILEDTPAGTRWKRKV
ncbi:MAG: cysteine--tRNA ligase [Candidatus Zixiibacteriota bacterium]